MRTKDQEAFDLAKHGWVFCDHQMLQGRLPVLREIAARLLTNDKRHEVLAVIEQAAE